MTVLKTLKNHPKNPWRDLSSAKDGLLHKPKAHDQTLPQSKLIAQGLLFIMV